MGPQGHGTDETSSASPLSSVSLNASASMDEPPAPSAPRLRVEPFADRSYRLPILVSLAALLVVLVFLLALKQGRLPPNQWIYWGAVVLTVIPGILSRNRLALAFGIGAFAFIQCFSYFLVAPYNIVWGNDEIYNMQLAEVITEAGRWVVRMGTGQAQLYSYYPGSTLFHVALAMTSGLALSTVYLFGVGLLRFAVLPLTVYKIFRRFVGEFPSSIAVIVYLATPSYLFDMPVLQEFAIVFGFLALYATLLAPVVRSRFPLSPPTLVATIIFLATVAVSHYFTSYVFIFVLVALAIASVFRLRRRSRRERSSAQQAFSRALRGLRYSATAFVYIFVLWSVYVSSPVDLFWVDAGTTTFQDAFAPGSLNRGGGSSPGGARAGYSYSSVQILLMVAALALLALTAFLGAVIVARRSRRGSQREKATARILLVLFLVGVMLGVAAAPLWFTSGTFVPLRILEFTNLGLAPLSGIFFAATRRKRFPGHAAIVAVAIAVLVIGGSLVQTPTPRFYYAEGPNPCEVSFHLTPDVVAAALWAKDHINSTTRILGDTLMFDAFGAYGRFQVYTAGPKVYFLFNSTQVDANFSRETGLQVGDIVVVDTYMTSTICFPSQRATPSDPAGLAKFSTSTSFGLLFQNDDVSIYRWDGSK